MFDKTISVVLVFVILLLHNHYDLFSMNLPYSFDFVKHVACLSPLWEFNYWPTSLLRRSAGNCICNFLIFTRSMLYIMLIRMYTLFIFLAGSSSLSYGCCLLSILEHALSNFDLYSIHSLNSFVVEFTSFHRVSYSTYAVYLFLQALSLVFVIVFFFIKDGQSFTTVFSWLHVYTCIYIHLLFYITTKLIQVTISRSG